MNMRDLTAEELAILGKCGSFALYGNAGAGGIKALDLLKMNRGELFIRAESSGCEGCYVEVARWHEGRTLESSGWRRYAFLKVFRGDLGPELDELSDSATAGIIALILQAYHGDLQSVIHSFKAWGE